MRAALESVTDVVSGRLDCRAQLAGGEAIIIHKNKAVKQRPKKARAYAKGWKSIILKQKRERWKGQRLMGKEIPEFSAILVYFKSSQSYCHNH